MIQGDRLYARGSSDDKGAIIAILAALDRLKTSIHRHYGNAPYPAMMLAQLLTSMKDESGRVVIVGFYDGVKH